MRNCWCGNPTVVSTPPDVICSASVYHDPRADGRPRFLRVLYLSGPMTGVPDCNYPLFNRVAEELREAGWQVVNPAEFGPTSPCHYTDLLRDDLRRLLDCDGVVTLEGWWESAGARHEVMTAGLLKMPVGDAEVWLNRKPSRLTQPIGAVSA